MHPRFERHLERLNDLAAEDLDPELSPEEREDLNGEIEGVLTGYSRRSGISVEGEIEIYGMQLRKQDRMQRLYKELRDIDSPEATQEENEDAFFVAYENGQYRTVIDGEACVLSEGEVLTAGEWGYHLQLDRDTVPRAIRKRHVVESAKREIRSYVDEQIYLEEVNGSRPNRTFNTEAYSAILRERDGELVRQGVVAEKVVATFFERLQYDSDLDFNLEPVDIYQDVVKKVDFIIKKHRHERGVQVEEHDSTESTGIQFTLNQSQEVLAKKREQIERARSYIREGDEIQDILLVSLSPETSREVWEAYQAWREAGKPTAVDGYLSDATKEVLFRNVLGGIYSEEEITAQWEKVAGSVEHLAA